MTKHYMLSLICGLCLASASSGQTIVTVSGTGASGFSGDGGPAVDAQLHDPTCVTRDLYGNLYIADRFNHRVRRVDANTGVITTVVGTGVAGYSGDGGPALDALLHDPIGLAVGPDGTIYVADNLNDCIRKIDPSGIISTYAGTGTAGYSGDSGPATAGQLHGPWGLALDSEDNLYIADRENDRVRMVAHATGTITTVAGTGTAGYSGNGGPATAANFNKPISVALDTAGNLFIADEDNHRVRKVFASTGFVEKIAGTGTGGYNGDGIAAGSARLNYPSGVGVDNAGNVYIGDRVNHRIRKVNTSGIISTIAGTGNVGFSGDGGNATSAMLNYPRNLFADGSGNIYFGDTGNDRVRKITYCHLPDIPVLAASQAVICGGESTILSIASGDLNDAAEWNWYSGSCGGILVGSGDSITVSPASTTSYFVRGEGGCATPYGCGTVTIQVQQAPDQPSAIVGDSTICAGSSATYSIPGVPGATSYTWTLPQGWTGTSNTTSVAATAGTTGGMLSVVANNSCGSSPAQTFEVATVQADTAVSLLDGDLSVSATADAYQWLTCPSMDPIVGATGPSFTPDQNGSYAVTVTMDGCSLTSGCHEVLTTGLPEPPSSGSVSVAPNPTNGRITITAAGIGTGMYQVELFDLLGQQLRVSTLRINGDQAVTQFDLTGFPDGIYWVRLGSSSGSRVVKVQKIH